MEAPKRMSITGMQPGAVQETRVSMEYMILEYN